MEYDIQGDIIYVFTNREIKISYQDFWDWIQSNDLNVYENDVHEVRGGELFEDTSSWRAEFDEIPNIPELLTQYIKEKNL